MMLHPIYLRQHCSQKLLANSQPIFHHTYDPGPLRQPVKPRSRIDGRKEQDRQGALIAEALAAHPCELPALVDAVEEQRLRLVTGPMREVLKLGEAVHTVVMHFACAWRLP